MRPRRGVRSESSALAVKAPLSRRTPKLRAPARRVDLSQPRFVHEQRSEESDRETLRFAQGDRPAVPIFRGLI